MSALRVVQVSDPHLGAAAGSEREDAADAAWRGFRDAMMRERPELIVVTGDIVVHDPDDAADQRRAHAAVAALPGRVLTVPGNHDVGDHDARSGLPLDWHGPRVTSERVRSWERVWGRSFWLHDIDRWSLLGLNSQLFGSGLPEEDAQWAWLETELARVGSRPLVVLMHEALDLFPAGTGRTPTTDGWMSIPTAASQRLVELLRPLDLRLVASGHTHRFLEWERDGIRQVTAPSLTGVIPQREDMAQPEGLLTTGWLALELDEDGVTIEREQSGIDARS